MGKGDKKTRRGKILMGSHGVRRPRRKHSRSLPLMAVKEETPALKVKPAVKQKVEKPESETKLPQATLPVAEVVKPARKKAPPKAPLKKDEETAE